MTDSVDKPERRKFTRIPFIAEVQIVATTETFSCGLIDISLKGVLVTRPNNWIENADSDHYLLELRLNKSDTTIRMEVSTVHSEDGQLGFRCEHIDLDSITHLRRLVELNVGDTKILDRELSMLGHSF